MNVWLIGGEKVIPASVETAIKGDGYTVSRINGSDRYETAKLIAAKGIELNGGKKPSKVFVASGTSFADALAVSPIAFVKGYPIALTEKDSTSQFTKDELGAIGTDNKILVGGEAVVSKKVQADLSIKDEMRVAGADRAVTANLVSDWAKKSEGFNPANAALVGGTNGNGADSLVAASLAGKSFTTLHFAGWDATTVYFKDHAAELTGKGFVFGGKAAVSQGDVDKAQAAAQTVAAMNSIKVTPSDAKTLVVPTVDDKTDDRAFSASGLNGDLEYRITLVAAANISVDASGNVKFKSSADSASKSGFSADPGTRSATITVVNGSPVSGSAQTATAKPVNGALSFTIDGGASAEDVVPVVYVNGGPGMSADKGGPSTRLETNASAAGEYGTAAEYFGLGGLTTFVPVEASAGTLTADQSITLVSKANKYIVAGGKTYFYDSGDTFRINGAPVTLEKFEANLSKGDGILSGSIYAANKDLQSTFNLNDLTPTAVLGVTAAAQDESTMRVTWTPAGTAPDSYVIYRKTGTETNTLADYTKVGTVAGDASPLRFDDKGLTAATRYAYAVTQVVDGDESPLDSGNGSADDELTAAAGTSAVPQSVAAGLTEDGSFAGTVSAGDEFYVAFSRPMAAIATGDTIRLQDANGESVDLVEATNATMTLNTSGQTFKGKTYEAGTLLKVVVGSSLTVVDRDGNTSNNNGSVDYAATIVAQSGISSVVNGVDTAWTPNDDPAKVVDAAPVTAPTNLGPKALSAVFTDAAGTATAFDGAADKVVITFDEEIDATRAGESVTIGGVTLTTGTNATFTKGTGANVNQLIVTWSTATTGDIAGVVGKSVTAISGVNDTASTPAGSRGLPIDVS